MIINKALQAYVLFSNVKIITCILNSLVTIIEPYLQDENMFLSVFIVETDGHETDFINDSL